MKLIHITFRFEFAAQIEKILDVHGVVDFVRYPMVEGRDSDGRHYGSQVFPGNMTIVQALLEEERVEPLLADLRRFRDGKRVHNHVRAAVMPIEQTL